MTQNQALIGYTGFVGSNILAQHAFEFLYNSKNIEDICGKEFETVVCAGVPAVKWLANKEPDQDLATIHRLIKNLEKIKTNQLILISTIDVYSQTQGIDESCKIDIGMLQPYGKHRRLLEEFAEQNFNTLIIRLPGLFGPGLKKNPLFDLMNNNLTYIHPQNLLQFYNLNNIWKDIEISLQHKLPIVNFVTEPLLLAELAKNVFALELPAPSTPPSQTYDIHTKYGSIWQSKKPYLYLKDMVLEDIKQFISSTSR